jgi:hypothetical protein
MNMIILAVAMAAAFLLGSWVTYRATQHKSPVEIPQIIKDMVDDMEGPISPYEQEQKARTVKVKI